MTNYRAIVSITFDDEDLEEFAESLGVFPRKLDAYDTINGELDNLQLGTGWVEQLFENKRPTLGRSSSGLTVEINDHEDPEDSDEDTDNS